MKRLGFLLGLLATGCVAPRAVFETSGCVDVSGAFVLTTAHLTVVSSLGPEYGQDFGAADVPVGITQQGCSAKFGGVLGTVVGDEIRFGYRTAEPTYFGWDWWARSDYDGAVSHDGGEIRLHRQFYQRTGKVSVPDSWDDIHAIYGPLVRQEGVDP